MLSRSKNWQSPKLCGVTEGKDLGPYFFEDEAESSLIITGKRYPEILENIERSLALSTKGIVSN